MTEQEKEAREKEVEEWLESYTGPIIAGPIRTSREAEVDGFIISLPYHEDDWTWDAIKNPRTGAEFTEEDTNDVPKKLTTLPQD